MVGKTTARNQTQQNLGALVGDRVTNANTGLFTATRKTRITSAIAIVNAVGADATYALAIKRGSDFFPIANFVDATAGNKSELNGSYIMVVGDILTNIGDSGAINGTIDMTANIEEL